MTLTDAVRVCNESGQSAWELVRFAQSFVHGAMAYSYTNSYDRPTTALKKGKGYCWQQAKVLMLILKKLGFRCHMVYATANRFPPTQHEGISVPSRTSGHVWCRVNVNGMCRDFCPGSELPDHLHFEPLSKVRHWNPLVSCACYFASAQTNKRRYKDLMASKR